MLYILAFTLVILASADILTNICDVEALCVCNNKTINCANSNIHGYVFKVDRKYNHLDISGTSLSFYSRLLSENTFNTIIAKRNNLNTIPIKKLKHVKKLNVSHNTIKFFKIVKSLEWLSVSHNNNISLKVDHSYIPLKYLDASHCNLNSFDLVLHNLEELLLSNNNILVIDIRMTNGKVLHLNNNKITHIKHISNVELVNVENNKLSQIFYSSIHNVSTLYASKNKLLCNQVMNNLYIDSVNMNRNLHMECYDGKVKKYIHKMFCESMSKEYINKHQELYKLPLSTHYRYDNYYTVEVTNSSYINFVTQTITETDQTNIIETDETNIIKPDKTNIIKDIYVNNKVIFFTFILSILLNVVLITYITYITIKKHNYRLITV